MLERAKYGLAFSNAAILKSYSILDTLAAEQDRFEQLLNFFQPLFPSCYRPHAEGLSDRFQREFKRQMQL